MATRDLKYDRLENCFSLFHISTSLHEMGGKHNVSRILYDTQLLYLQFLFRNKKL